MKEGQTLWTRDQTIVALRAYFIVPFNSASNTQEEIVKTAAIIGRDASSVKMKIGNFGSLDAELAKRGIRGLTGSSKLDRLIWSEYANDREKLAIESERLIAQFTANKQRGILEVDRTKTGEDVYRLTKTRVHQDFFREQVVGLYEKACCITGISSPELLVASHILPWAKDKANRLNPENGLCLNALHDKAFDRGLLTVMPDYRVRVSRRIVDMGPRDVIDGFFMQYDGNAIALPERYHPNSEFLRYHNDFIFQK